ncbi:MAG: gamma-glutamyl-gamma-aminobutyrate hydrolase family protein [Chromatiaceae bacterium]|nr:gamma-glutamyl-gamma-aminobutyrate hydrolase family protein [Chromatiaceae bacterium]
MRAHYFQHVPFEGLGSIEAWLTAHGFAITATKFFESAEIPALHQIDLLVVLGGPMSVNEEAQFRWLAAEKAYLREAVVSGKPVLGICLGAQLIASAMGSGVYPNSAKEIGWFPINGIAVSNHSAFNFPQTVQVFHWHGETFDLPAGAVHLASSDGCTNQAFQIGTSVIGLQFHLETTPESLQRIVANCRDEIVPARYIQTEDEMRSADAAAYRSINRMMDDVLSHLTKR